MRLRLGLVLVLLAVLPSGAAVAAPDVAPAVQKQNYFAPNGVRTDHYDDQIEQLPQGVGMRFTPRAGDASVHLTVADAYKRFVLVHVFQEDARTGERVRHTFCATQATIPVLGERPVDVYVYSGLCTNHNFGYATTGTVTAKFSTAKVATAGHKRHNH